MIGKCKGTGEMAICRHFSVAPLSQDRRFHATASVAVGSTTGYKHPLILRLELGVSRKKSGAKQTLPLEPIQRVTRAQVRFPSPPDSRMSRCESVTFRGPYRVICEETGGSGVPPPSGSGGRAEAIRREADIGPRTDSESHTRCSRTGNRLQPVFCRVFTGYGLYRATLARLMARFLRSRAS